jgi:hypothetical protein
MQKTRRTVPILETGGTMSVVKTLRDRLLLEEQWSSGKAKWKVW